MNVDSNSRPGTLGLGERRSHPVGGEDTIRGWLCWLADGLRSSWRRWHARPAKQLRLCESLALGERRFLVVVEFGRQKFLLGTSSSAMTLLAELPDATARDADTRCEAAAHEARNGDIE